MADGNDKVFGEKRYYPYVQASTYNPAGQLKSRSLGTSPALTTWWGYFGYSAADGTGDGFDDTRFGDQFLGRLARTCTGQDQTTDCPAPPDGSAGAVQDLRYWYDAVGNVTAIRDYPNANQVQQFRYDELNRLADAWTEPAWDIANVIWDIHEVRRNPSLLNIGALVVDVGATVLPFVPAGVGMVARGGKAAKIATHWDEAVDAARVAGRLDEAVDAVTAARRLREVGVHADEAGDLIKAMARQSTRGSGERVVIGKWVEGGGYIAEAQKHGGVFFATDRGVWEALGKDPELAWAVNEQFLRSQLEAGVGRIELVGETIEQVERHAVGTFRWREIQFLKKHAAEYGYELVGNIWIKVR